MGIESLEFGQPGDRINGLVGHSVAIVNGATSLEKGVDTDAAGKTCCGARGQAVAGARVVIAGGHRGLVSEEEFAPVAQAAQPSLGVLHGEVDVFGRDGVGQCSGLIGPLDEESGGFVFERSLNGLYPAALGQLDIDLGGDGLQYFPGPRNQKTFSRIVLGLGNQVSGHPTGIRAGVGHGDDLTWPVETAVGPTRARHGLLGQLNKNIARPRDHFHRLDAFGAEGEGGHRLSTPNSVEGLDTEHPATGQQFWG